MRVLFLVPFLITILLSGCEGDHPWRDEHRGVLKGVRGFSGEMILIFDDGHQERVHFEKLSSCSHSWEIGQEIVLKKQTSGGVSYYIILDPRLYDSEIEKGS